MGSRGPAPRPTNLTKFLGNPGHRVFNKAEPQPDTSMPECPDWLNDKAKAEWERVAPELHRIGILTQVDRTMLAGYCQAYARWMECEEAINANGITFLGRLGLQMRPEVAAAHKLMGIIRQFCSEFGLTPSSRARMTLPTDDGDDEDDGLD